MPFTVDELVAQGMTVMDACMVVWDVPEREFAHYVDSKGQTREWTGHQVVRHSYGGSRG